MELNRESSKDAVYETVDYNAQGLRQAAEAIRRDGVAVIRGVFGVGECVKRCRELVDCLKTISPKLDDKDLTTWIPANLPSGPRSGLMQSLVANFPPVWAIRTDARIRAIFEAVYSDLRGEKVTDFYSSMDGINVRPSMKPYQRAKHDWAHIDQVSYDNPFWCVQGQVVLNDSTACFRASPKSHLIYTDLLKMAGVKDSRAASWCKFKAGDRDTVRKMVEEAGGAYQVPIRAPRGSVILWTSSTVHSAMSQSKPVDPLPSPTTANPYPDWRFVVYACYRPKSECYKGHDERLKTSLADNRVTNHAGMKMFPRRVERYPVARNSRIDRYHDSPSAVMNALPLKITDEMRRLTEKAPVFSDVKVVATSGTKRKRDDDEGPLSPKRRPVEQEDDPFHDLSCANCERRYTTANPCCGSCIGCTSQSCLRCWDRAAGKCKGCVEFDIYDAWLDQANTTSGVGVYKVFKDAELKRRGKWAKWQADGYVNTGCVTYHKPSE